MTVVVLTLVTTHLVVFFAGVVQLASMTQGRVDHAYCYNGGYNETCVEYFKQDTNSFGLFMFCYIVTISLELTLYRQGTSLQREFKRIDDRLRVDTDTDTWLKEDKVEAHLRRALAGLPNYTGDIDDPFLFKNFERAKKMAASHHISLTKDAPRLKLHAALASP